jgi:hypothetical protein
MNETQIEIESFRKKIFYVETKKDEKIEKEQENGKLIKNREFDEFDCDNKESPIILDINCKNKIKD